LKRELRKFRQNCESAKAWKSEVAANNQKQTSKGKVESQRLESQSAPTRMINSYKNSNNSNDVIAHHSSPPSCLLVPNKHKQTSVSQVIVIMVYSEFVSQLHLFYCCLDWFLCWCCCWTEIVLTNTWFYFTRSVILIFSIRFCCRTNKITDFSFLFTQFF